jgi:hypothetical protein
LTEKGVDYELLVDYGQGHSVPKDTASLTKMYRFFGKYLQPSSEKPSGLKSLKT